MMCATLFFMEFVDMALRVCNMSRYEGSGVHEESFFEELKMFQQWTRLNYDTFHSLTRVVGQSLEWKNTHMKQSIPIETRVVMAFTQLSSANSLEMCGKVYGIATSTTSIIVRELCSTIRNHLKPLVIPKLIRNKIKKIIVSFESLHGIPYIQSAIDGNYIPIVAPKVDPKSYYCWKGFYSTLIQGNVNAKCIFWDYDYGWVGSIHDWVLFQKNNFRKSSDERHILTL